MNSIASSSLSLRNPTYSKLKVFHCSSETEKKNIKFRDGGKWNDNNNGIPKQRLGAMQSLSALLYNLKFTENLDRMNGEKTKKKLLPNPEIIFILSSFFGTQF